MSSDYGKKKKRPVDPDEIWQDPEWLRYAKHVREHVIPNLEGSQIFVSLTPGSKDKVDIKFALELGLAIMYNKPIVAVIEPGQQLSEKFVKVVDKFVELDYKDPTQRERLTDALKEMAKFRNAPPCDELGPGDGLDPRFDPVERKPGNRKALQLCAQVADALNMALADCGDECLREAFVESVVPAPDSSHMLVRIRTTIDKELVLEALQKASGKMRNEIAGAIHRKKVPQLRFEVSKF